MDHHADVAKPKFTLTECAVAITASIALVIVLAVLLVNRIEDVVEAGVPDQFLGLILLPFVEKAAEHLTSIDEAWDGQMVGLSIPTSRIVEVCLLESRILLSTTVSAPLSKRRFSTVLLS